ncbi:hypothetical protein [Microbacterium sp. WCS2018Hpa-9]|uniref:hypothetical protein n=1 Tax=Microbacterium sp. WCS2018Hpa-9 TaxID=3073635 RepID=UPI00288C5CEC|nr:hypothetical protein [Microbacterium sp. WCS2018Hpa-9]
MLHESESAELRALQGKAYGRDGGLTEAEASRLVHLESMRAEPDENARAAAVTGGQGADPVDVPRAAEDSLPPHVEAPASDMRREDPDDEGADGRRPLGTGGLRAAIRQHWKAAVAASAAMLVIGLGVGWALFGHTGDAVALTSEQQQRRAELQAEGGFDAGSLRAIGRDEDALVWFATKNEGETICITLDTADKSADQCQPAADLDNGNGIGISASVIVANEDGEAAEQVWASAARAMNGEVVGIVQRWRSDQDSWLAQFQGEERDRAEQLVEEGFEEYSFSIVGYFRDAPVWYGQRIEDDVAQDCLIVDAVAGVECRVAGDVSSSADGIRVSGATVDESGQPADQWTVTLAYTPNGVSYLVVSGDLDASQAEQTVKPGETLELGGEKQDPIQVDIPSDDSDG